MPCNNMRGSCPSDTITNCNSPERVCIQATRVFDACISQFTLENQSIAVTFPSTVSTFVSARSDGSAVISNVVITPQAGSVCSRIRYSVTIPLQVVGIDTSGNTVLGTASVTLERDLLLRVPREAVVPTEVQVTANIVGVNGSLSGNLLTISLCITLITKIVADVELLIQTYGYPALPNCQEYTEDLCSGVFNQPIYPR